jgi:hypothetical protein
MVEIPRVKRSLDGRLKEDILEFIRVFKKCLSFSIASNGISTNFTLIRS